MRGKQNFSFQEACLLNEMKVGGINFFNTRNLGGMILLTRSAIVFVLGVTNVLKEYLVSIHGKLDVYSY